MKSIYGFNGAAIAEQISRQKNYHSDLNEFYSSDWICFLDADDTYEPDYLKELLDFALWNSLKLAVCGWDFVRPNEIDHRVSDTELIYERDSFASALPQYDKFMGPVWNKLFSIDLFTNISNINYFEDKFAKLHSEGVFFYGADSCFNYILLSRLEKFGILNKSLYKYNILDTSASRKNFHPMRIVADRKLAQCRFDFLKELGCNLSDENRDFIFNIYMKSTMSTIQILLNSDKELKEKLSNLHKMFLCDYMDELFGKNV
jgi:glycosyltransferase involved in cell wall biosynthesis